MKEYTSLWAEWKLSSGETVELENAQSQFNHWLEKTESDSESFEIPEESTWVFDPDSDDNETRMQDFFIYIRDNISKVPPHKYILRYLLMHFKIMIGEHNYAGLWKHVENPKWRISAGNDQAEFRDALQKKLSREAGEEVPALDEKDYKNIITILCSRLKDCYPDAIMPAGSWTTYFRKLVMNPSPERLRDLALALEWDWETFHLFRAKVLKHRALDLLDREDILFCIALNYAKECGLKPFDAYFRLLKLYPEIASPDKTSESSGKTRKKKAEAGDGKKAGKAASDQNTDNNAEPVKGEASRRIGEMLSSVLPESGSVSAGRTMRLFTDIDPDIQEILREARTLKNRKVMRSPQKAFQDEWEKLSKFIEGQQYYLGNDNFNRHDIFKLLYGNNVEKLVTGPNGNRIVDLSDNQMVLLAPDESPDFFLDSKEFLDTRIRDNDFYEATFTTNEVRQRNLLLTMAFLNYALSGVSLLPYELRLAEFSFNTTDLLNKCGFMSLHGAGAYDSFLKLLLSCDDPFSLFQYIWYKKTGSEPGV